ncbi:MAG: thiamine ABC transporter substrate-binding protein [Chloroflexi bacterium]|nr:thiamine ABC transporter substrate-binding protein [Chloroflexota bacterium]MDL1941348.1 thiamine ABC transporter substrate-binding protein [Chloroflexi bacterium CFX2]
MKKILLLTVYCLLLSACASKGPATLTVMTHDSFAISEDVITAFETANNADVVFLASGDTGTMLNKAILAKDAPLADVLFGVDNTFLSRALEADIFEPYQSPALSDVPAEFVLDPSFRALPVDYGDVCINYDKKYFKENNLPVPQSFEDLAKPEYKGLLVVEHPATSSPGLAFMLATRAHFGDDFLDYWQSLKDNGVVVVDSWETAYYTNFSASSGQGPQPMVVSYASSPAAEVFFASEPLSESPTASIVASGMCFRQIEFVGILKNGQNRDLAEKFIDFMLGKQFQEDMPLNMFVYPVNQSAQLPEVFTQYAQVAEQPANISYDDIAANRDAWIEAWSEVMK